MSTEPLLPPPQPGYPPQGAYGGTSPPQGTPAAPPGAMAPPPSGSAPQAPPVYKGDVPNEDVHENSSGQAPPQAAAPPVARMDEVSGYENVGFEAGSYIPPPSYEQAVPQASAEAPRPNIPTISEDDARRALVDHVSAQCCYGKTAANDLVFTNITPSSAFHYQLETFTEGRKTAWEYEPYKSQLIDGPQNGPAPGPWDIQAAPNQLFQDHVKHFEVPHTASIKVCHNCMGAGVNRCWRCLGRGQVICGNCDGSGCVLAPVVHHDHDHHHHHHHHHDHHHHHHAHVDMERVFCHHCNGTGRKRCWTCNGCGQLQCTVCRGRGQLKCYIKLTVTWKNNKVDHVVERTALPDHLIRGAQGQMAFEDQQLRVAPVTNFPDSAVNNASNELVQSHAISFPTERIVMQRHWIRIVPVSEVSCNWKGKTFAYWVYGYDNQVYAPDYPQKVCCGCSIL